jgi:serine/threonine-protein kinase
MPVPTGGNIEGSTNFVCNTAQNDCHLLVADTTQQKLFELYNATQSGSAFTALGAFVWDLNKAYPDNERGDQCTSADAAGFPIAGLLPTADEVAAGAVNHAIRFILPNARMRKSVYVHPASHAGAPSSTNANAPPYGVRFRLKAAFDETSYSAGAKVILHAMKTYGMLLSDGGNIALTFADDRTTTAKWAGQSITALSFMAITPNDFEVVDLGSPITVTDNCVRNP